MGCLCVSLHNISVYYLYYVVVSIVLLQTEGRCEECHIDTIINENNYLR